MTVRGPRRRAPADAVVLALAGAFVVVLNLTPIYENDFWIQLAVGDLIRATGSIPRTILFACTEAADRPFVAHEWLPSVAESVLFARVGYAGMIVVKCALAIVLFAFVRALAMRRGSAPAVASGVGALVLLAVNFRTQMRPELPALILFAGLLLLLERLAAAPRAGLATGAVGTAGAAAVGLVWANCHGSFVLAPCVPLIFLAGALLGDGDAAARIAAGEDASTVSGGGRRSGGARRHAAALATAAIGIAVATFVNPYGPRLWLKVLDLAREPFIRASIVEFAPTFDPRIRGETYWLVHVAFLALTAASFFGWRRRGGATPLLLYAAFGALSLDAMRFAVWFAVACAPVLGHNLAGFGRAAGRRAVTVGLAAALALGTGVVAFAGNVRGMHVGFADASPLSRGAIAALRTAGLRGNVFNSYRLGDQIVHEFWPDARVTIDSRVDAYGREYFERYLALSGRSLARLGPPADLLAFLDRYSIDTIVSMPYDYRNWALRDHAEALRRAGWREIYRDDSAVILARRPA